MRTAVAVLLLAAAFPLAAQTEARPRPPGTIPLNDVPPPPPMVEADPGLEPQLSTRRDGPNTVTEYRVKGKLFMMRVTPPHGRPYILMDHRGDGQFARQDTLDPGVRVPQWVLVEF